MLSSRVLLRALVLLPTLALLAACSAPDFPPEQVRRVRVAHPEPAQGAASGIYPGTVQARFESALGFRVGGKIRGRLVDAGAEVKRGDVLLKLDPQDLKLAESAARATVASAQAALAQARSEHERFEALYTKNYVSQLEHDAKANALSAATAQLQQAQAQLDASRNQRDYSQLRADADGVITAVSAEPGQVVAAGQPLLSLAHSGAREVVIDLPEQHVAQHQVGDTVAIDLWSEAGSLHSGHIREIAPAADATTRTYRVRVAFTDGNSPARLGQTARVHFPPGMTAAQWRLPLSALYEKNGAPALWRLDPSTGQLHLIVVTIGSYDINSVLIDSGVEAEDWIATAGVHRLLEGEKVVPIDNLNRDIPL